MILSAGYLSSKTSVKISATAAQRAPSCILIKPHNYFSALLVSTEFPQIKSILLTFGNIDVILDLKTLWQIYNVLFKENKHLHYLLSRADMQILKEKINTTLVLKNKKSVVSDIMMKDSYILFVPEQMFVNDFVDFTSFKHFIMQLGKLSITCVNKRNTIGAPGNEAMKQVIALNDKYLATFKNTSD